MATLSLDLSGWRGRGHKQARVREVVMLTNLILNLNKTEEDASIEAAREWWQDNPNATLKEIEQEMERQIRERERESDKKKK